MEDGAGKPMAEKSPDMKRSIASSLKAGVLLAMRPLIRSQAEFISLCHS